MQLEENKFAIMLSILNRFRTHTANNRKLNCLIIALCSHWVTDLGFTIRLAQSRPNGHSTTRV